MSMFVFPDIHGHARIMLAAMEKCGIDWTRDEAVFLGDYIDRGPDSALVIECLLNLRESHPGRVHCLMGNHEEMLLMLLERRDPHGMSLLNGGMQTLKSYGCPVSFDPAVIQFPERHQRFLRSLKLYHETRDYVFVHAGLWPSNQHVSRHHRENILWIREDFIDSDFDWGKRIIYGHTPFDEPRVEPNKIGIDLGVAYCGRYCVLKLPEVEFTYVTQEEVDELRIGKIEDSHLRAAVGS